jgi:hypothetical protein
MTDDLTHAEAALRSVLATRADELPPPLDVYPGVRRRVRRRRSVVAAGAAAALVAAGVPAALAATGTTPGPVPAAPAGTAAGTLPVYDGPCEDDRPPHDPVRVPALPAQRDVRGSLGADAAVVAAVLKEGYAAVLAERPREYSPPEPDPSTARVVFVERVQGRIAGLVTAEDTRGDYGWTAWVTGTDAAHLRGHWNSGGPGVPELQRSGNQWVCGHEYATIATDPGTTGTISWVSDIDAAARPVWVSAPIPLRPDGIAVFGLPPGPTRVTLSNDAWVGLGRSGSPSARPSVDEVRRAVAAAPGTGDDRVILDLAFVQPDNPMALPEHDLRVHWKGRAGTADVVVASVAFPSGARFVWTAWQRGSQLGSANGVLPAGALDRTVLASRLDGPGRPLVVFAPGGVRAEIVRGPGRAGVVDLEGGGAIVPNGADVTLVRAYDRNGTLIGERAPDTGLTKLPR